MWNEHPYYILDVPWSDSRQRAAAAAFLGFLMSEGIQKRALEHGFGPEIPMCRCAIPTVRSCATRAGAQSICRRPCEPSKDRVLEELLASFRRIEERSLPETHQE